MIYRMMGDFESTLRARKFPSQFVYGPERVTRTGFFDHVIVVERDTKAPDVVAPCKGWENNARKMRIRELCVKATVYAVSRVDGARREDHEGECEQIVDALLIAMAEWGTAARAGE